MIQVRMIPLPVPSKAWAAHFQMGHFGKKDTGDYVSGHCLITDVQARLLMLGKRSVSYRFGSTEAYFQQDDSFTVQESKGRVITENLYFGGSLFPFKLENFTKLFEQQTPLNPEFQQKVEEELSHEGKAWEDRHASYALTTADKAEETMH
jgi:hypothetical protein